MKDIVVKINRSERRGRFIDGYQDGDPLEAALSIQVFDPSLNIPDGGNDPILEKVFEALNAPHFVPLGTLTERQVIEYHQNYPSLSVGDVVEVNSQPYAVQSVGFEKLERDDSKANWVYLPPTDVAKLCRKVLKQRFPDTKFSVRTNKYAGGASIDVGWWDGPLDGEVKEILRPLEGYSHMDISDYVHTKKSVFEGKAFNSGARYIFTKRQLSKAFLTWIAKRVIDDHDLKLSVPAIKETAYGAWLADDSARDLFDVHGEQISLDRLIEAKARQTRGGRGYSDKPEVRVWTDDDGNTVKSTYFHGQVKSKWDGGKNTEYATSEEWQTHKTRLLNLTVSTNEELETQHA